MSNFTRHVHELAINIVNTSRRQLLVRTIQCFATSRNPSMEIFGNMLYESHKVAACSKSHIFTRGAACPVI
jgi:hypothetical protein